MKKFTKTLALVTAVVIAAMALTACGEQKKDSAADKTEQTSTDAKTIKFGTNAEFPPFEFVSNKGGVIGEFDGIDMAMAKQIAEDNGMTAEVNNMEFDSLLVALQNGQLDAVIAGMTVTDERKEAVDFSEPYYTATQVMIVKNDSTITKAADMADKKIAVIQGYTGETVVKDMGYKYEAFKRAQTLLWSL